MLIGGLEKYICLASALGSTTFKPTELDKKKNMEWFEDSSAEEAWHHIACYLYVTASKQYKVSERVHLKR